MDAVVQELGHVGEPLVDDALVLVGAHAEQQVLLNQPLASDREAALGVAP